MRIFKLIAAASTAIALAVSASAQEKGGVLKVALHPEPPSAVAGISGLGAAEILTTKIYESLFSYDFDLTPQPSLAETWSTSENGLTFTVQLKPNVRWHDGEAFDSADVVTSYNVFSKANPNLAVLVPQIDSVTATGPLEVTFKLKNPVPALIYGLAPGGMSIIPDHIYGGDAPFRENPANSTPVGTGPFKLANWEKGNFIKLVRNDDYHVDGQPYLDELFFVIIPDSQGRAVAYEQGSIDVVSASNLELFDVARLANLKGSSSTNKGWEFFSPHAFLWVNNEKAPFNDRNFRKALNYAMDKEFIRDVVFSGLATPPKGPIGSRTRFFDAETEGYEFNKDKARELVKASSYDGREIQLMPSSFLGSSWGRLAEYQVQALKDVGINVSLNSMDPGSFLKRLADRDYDMAQMYLYQRADPAIGVSRNFLSVAAKSGSPWNNVAMYKDAEADALIQKADSETDTALRAELYSKAQRRIADQAPVVWLGELEFPTIYKDKVKNLITNAAGLSANFANVWIED
ncbi:ABC transporter substrate-binding protein [Thalassovita sp.]|uniref:ABC transporter substrate-binding protein n=1 Tax=Thalassovita sp. TaxID=1979401 RepID=UPI0029DE70EB|nr:ABC transporter substrate-binding protein [Thalassovita sp.]